MELILIPGYITCKIIYHTLKPFARYYKKIEGLLMIQDKRDRLQMGYLDEYLTDELITQVQDKKMEKERREDIEKLVKDLEKLKEIAIIKKLDTLKVAEFYEVHKNQFNRNLSAKKFCKLICVQFGIDYNDKIYRNFQNNCLKVAELK